jgi:redox-sensitive bicupin YhaK (pirin superfamily)
MIQLRPSNARGQADHGWLHGYHSFSFADYYDPAEMGWGPLRVINEDFIKPGTGFGQHGHRDMEIITYLLEGPLEHKDSMNNGTVFRRPEVQRMSAGRGVQHSEFNPSDREGVHLLQIWIEPDVRGIAPEYEQKAYSDVDKRDRLALIASPDGAQGSLTIHQDARLYASLLSPGASVSHTLAPGRRAYLHLVSGELSVNGQRLAGGDGAKIMDETALAIVAVTEAEMLLFDLP